MGVLSNSGKLCPNQAAHRRGFFSSKIKTHSAIVRPFSPLAGRFELWRRKWELKTYPGKP